MFNQNYSNTPSIKIYELWIARPLIHKCLSEDSGKGQKVGLLLTSGFTLLFSAFSLDLHSGDSEGVGRGGVTTDVRSLLQRAACLMVTLERIM